MTSLDDIDAIANAAFEADLPPIRHAIYDAAGEPITCCICDGNRWAVERVLSDGTPVFSCSHGVIAGVIRQVDSVNGQRVARVEALE